jgi:hypothetical protein
MKVLINNSVVRWIAVLPMALLAAIAAMFPWHWVVLFFANFVGRLEGEENLGVGFLVRLIGPETIERLGYGFITPFVIIVIAAKVAPTYKVRTGRVAALLVSGMIIYSLFFGLAQYNAIDYFQNALGWSKLYPVVLIVIQVIGIYTALRFISKR